MKILKGLGVILLVGVAVIICGYVLFLTCPSFNITTGSCS